jgi:hypothetical protein
MGDEEASEDDRRQRRKEHLWIDASTPEIRAMEVTDNSIDDAPVPPALLDQTSADARIASVSGDGTYDMKDCHEGIAFLPRMPSSDSKECQAMENEPMRRR